MRVMVTGSREITDVDLVHDALSLVWEQYDSEPITVVHGGARGADVIAGAWARLVRKYGVKAEVFPAKWHEHTNAGPLPCPASHRGLPMCKMAGLRRNQEMVDTHPTLVLAFYRSGAGNAGTSDAVKRAKLANIPVIEYTQD